MALLAYNVTKFLGKSSVLQHEFLIKHTKLKTKPETLSLKDLGHPNKFRMSVSASEPITGTR